MLNISESLKKQREIILEESSEQALDRHTSLLEIAIISLYNRLANRLSSSSEDFRAGAAIAGLGAFGHGVSSPAQTVPVLCLQAEDTSLKDSWIDEITEPLVEAGWTVEPYYGSARQILERARADSELLFQLLDLRYISGNRALVDQLESEIDSYVEGNRESFFGTLRGSLEERRKRLEDADDWLEPDLDRNPGGLSEIRAIRAGCRIASNIRSLEDAIFQGYLTRQEVDLLQRAEKAFCRYLTLLKITSNEPGSTLHFRDQEALARKLGYSEKSGFLPVEIFMQQVHQLFSGVAEVSREFWERLEEIRSLKGEDRGEALEEGLLARFGKIHIQTERYGATPANLVHLFAVAASRRLGFANVTRQWISHNRNVLDASSGDSSVKSEFLEFLRSDGPNIPTLRRFHEYGLLTALIPELAPVQGLVQHDAFHLYPVQEHHLRTVSELKKTLDGHYSEAHPEITRIAAEINDPGPLLLAGLLHDIGKSSGSSHAARGGEMVPAIARRLALSALETDTVQFLVSQHLLLLDNAGLRDLADQEMLANCAGVIGRKEYLDQLALLSFADMMSTGPRAKEKWRDTPVLALYRILASILEKGEPSSQIIAEKLKRVKRQLETRLSDVIGQTELEAYCSQLAPRYLISISPEEMVKHLRLGQQLQSSGEPFVWEVSGGRETAEITLMSWDKPGLVSRSAGILTLHNLNIKSAQVFSMNNGIALLIFQCRLPEQARTGGGMDWNAVKKDMDRLYRGRLALDYRIAAHIPPGRQARGLRGTPSRIVIDNESSALYTILEVYTVDRIGLLYTIARTLHELQVLIYVAKITTKSDQVADAFYIRTDNREKVTDPEQVREIERALRYCLDGKAEWR